jgi:hypothetical protein
MKRPHILATGLLLLGLLGGVALQPHPTVERPPKDLSNPADVETIDGIMNAWYSSIAGEPGQPREWDRYKGLFVPDGRLVMVRPDGLGGTKIGTMTVDNFIEGNRRYMEQAGFVDTEISRTVETFGSIAQVFSTYASRRTPEDAEPYARGINSLQLTFDGKRWWIISVMWDQERPDNPIPAKYLVSPGK